MKKLLIFSLSLTLCTILSSQEIIPVFESLNPSINKNEDFILVQEYDLVWYTSDSVWKHTRNVTYTYNEFSKPDEKHESWTDGSGPYGKTKCIYDSIKHNLVEERIYKYSDSAWVDWAKNIYSYDGNNNRIQKTRKAWDGDQFENEIKNIYTYENNIKVYQMMYYWVDDNWEESVKFDFQYDENNNLYKILSEVWIENEWINSQKSIYTYDTANNNLLNIKASNWDSEISSWADHSIQQNYTYDLDNNRISLVIQHWDEYYEFWYNLYRTDYYYVPVGSETVENKNSDINKTIDDFQTTEDELIIEPGKDDKTLIGIEILIDSVLHSSDGDLEFTLSHNGINQQIISYRGGDGDNFISTKISDNGVGTIASGIAPFLGIYKPENPLSSFLETDPAGTWTLSIYDGVAGNTGTLQSWGLALTYSSSLGFNKKVENIQFKLYPNPASYQLNIESEHIIFSFSIFNITGQLIVNNEVITKEHQVNISGLKPGLYFIQLHTNKGAVSRKFTIRH